MKIKTGSRMSFWRPRESAAEIIDFEDMEVVACRAEDGEQSLLVRPWFGPLMDEELNDSMIQLRGSGLVGAAIQSQRTAITMKNDVKPIWGSVDVLSIWANIRICEPIWGSTFYR